MSCIINLYDVLNVGCPGDPTCGQVVPINGYWTLYSSPVGFPVSLLVNGSWEQILNNEQVIASGQYNPNVDLAGLPYGDYILAYHFGNGCEQISTLQLFGLEVPCTPATAIDVIVCDALGEIALYDILTQAMAGTECTPLPNGNWTVADATGLVWTQTNNNIGTDDIINTGSTTLDTQYVFTYTYWNENVDPQTVCDDCIQTLTLNITVSESPSAGAGGDITICT